MYDDILLFIKVVDYGGFTQASKHTSIPQPTISRRIKMLENDLNLVLIKRNSRYLELTQYGVELYHKFKDHENNNRMLLDGLYSQTQTIKGSLNVSLPPYLSSVLFDSSIPDFIRENPNLQLNIHYLYQDINMTKDNLDIAILAFAPIQQTQKAKLVHRSKIILCCTPEYIKKFGKLETLDDRDKHILVGPILRDNSKPSTVFMYEETTGVSSPILVTEKLRINGYSHVYNMVYAHNAVACLLESTTRDDIASGKLVRLIPDYHFGYIEFYLMSNLAINDARYLAFTAFIQQCLGKLL